MPIHHIFFIHSAIDVPIGRLPVLTTVSRAIVNNVSAFLTQEPLDSGSSFSFGRGCSGQHSLAAFVVVCFIDGRHSDWDETESQCGLYLRGPDS